MTQNQAIVSCAASMAKLLDLARMNDGDRISSERVVVESQEVICTGRYFTTENASEFVLRRLEE